MEGKGKKVRKQRKEEAEIFGTFIKKLLLGLDFAMTVIRPEFNDWAKLLIFSNIPCLIFHLL